MRVYPHQHLSCFVFAVLFVMTAMMIPAHGQEKKTVELRDLKLDFSLFKADESTHFHYLRKSPEDVKLKIIGDAGMEAKIKDGKLHLDHWVNLDMNYHIQRFKSQAVCLSQAGLPIQRIKKSQLHRGEIEGLELEVNPDQNAASYLWIRTKDEAQNINRGETFWESKAILDFHLFQMTRVMPFNKGQKVNLGYILRMQANPSAELVEKAFMIYEGKKIIRIEGSAPKEWHHFSVEGHAEYSPNYGFDIYLDDQRQLQRIEIRHLNSRFERIRPPQEKSPPA